MTTADPASSRTPGPVAEEGSGPRAAGRLAALKAIEQNSVRLNLPGVGTVTLPPPQHLAWYGGIAAVAALGCLEWPVAGVLVVGHLLAQDHHNRLVHDFGEALEEA
jgi:hypothetical protein